MTKEEKTELIKAICGYLYDGLYVKDDIVGKDFDEHGNAVYSPVLYTYYYHPNIDNCKPYLRPMTSMTEEEENEWWKFADKNTIVETHSYSIDWLTAHHLDYRGLIPKGLALPATDGMYNKIMAR